MTFIMCDFKIDHIIIEPHHINLSLEHIILDV